MKSEQCFVCGNMIDTEPFLACTAYPKGIPEAIVTGEHDHTKPYEGDNGIRFTPLPKE